MSRTHPLPTVMLPAAKLMIPPRKRTKVPNQSPAQKAEEASASTQKLPKKEIQEATSAESSKPVDNENKPNTQQIAADNNPLFNELTEIMLHRPDEFADLHELMNAATQGIAYGINLKRATVSLISKDGTRLKSYYSVGCQDSEILKDFGTKIVNNTIFDKLSNRPASIWVKETSS